MSGKRPEGRSPEANILASPKYSKTLPSAASEPPVSPSGPKSRTGPLYDDRCTPADGTPERALPKRAETAAGPKEAAAPVRQTHETIVPFRRPPNDRAGSPRHRPSPASGTTHTGNIPPERPSAMPFSQIPETTSVPDRREAAASNAENAPTAPGTNVRPDRNAAASACRTSPGKGSPAPCTKREQDRQTDRRSVIPSPEPQQKKAHGRTSAGPRPTIP